MEFRLSDNQFELQDAVRRFCDDTLPIGGGGERVGGDGDRSSWRALADLGVFGLLGIGGQSLEVARDYALTREQFNVPIGSFQALKHLMAEMFVRVELARSATYTAASVIDNPQVGDRGRAGRIAKVLAGEAALANSRAAVQILGGMGFTWATPAHFLLTRSWVLESCFGTTEDHARALGADLEHLVP